MDSSEPKPRVPGARNMMSMLLFAVAGVLLVVAGYLFIQDQREDDAPPPPPSIPGQAQLVNVRDVLVDAGLEVEYGRESARVEDLSPAGQQLIVDGQPLYVFIFSDPKSRQSETASMDLADIALADSFGDPITDEPLSVTEGSNIVIILAGADDDLRSSVAQAVETLP